MAGLSEPCWRGLIREAGEGLEMKDESTLGTTLMFLPSRSSRDESSPSPCAPGLFVLADGDTNGLFDFFFPITLYKVKLRA